MSPRDFPRNFRAKQPSLLYQLDKLCIKNASEKLISTAIQNMSEPALKRKTNERQTWLC